jgi:hypothetical protein
LPPSCADCLKIWEPQSAGTLKACNGIALPLPFVIIQLQLEDVPCRGDGATCSPLPFIIFHLFSVVLGHFLFQMWKGSLLDIAKGAF